MKKAVVFAVVLLASLVFGESLKVIRFTDIQGNVVVADEDKQGNVTFTDSTGQKFNGVIRDRKVYVGGLAVGIVGADKLAASEPAVAATTAKPAGAAVTPDAPAVVYFYRPRRYVGSAFNPAVFIDDARVGKLHNGDVLKFSLTPGTHRLHSTDKSTGLDLKVEPGKTYYVRIDIQNGFFKTCGAVLLMDPQQGQYEASQQAARHGANNSQ